MHMISVHRCVLGGSARACNSGGRAGGGPPTRSAGWREQVEDGRRRDGSVCMYICIYVYVQSSVYMCVCVACAFALLILES